MLFGDHLSVTDRSEVAYVTEGMSMAFLKEILSAATVAFSRGELPTRRDVDGALENLKQHRKQVVGGFMSRRSAGFAAPPENASPDRIVVYLRPTPAHILCQLNGALQEKCR